ncbi:MAG: organoarsenical effux MFS transporter ArsJ [Pikeienuella sp.]|uniref:organoarsenical effux MFS transporter ArsJ n=1 Tax=Pikeienuella sp. TaxID=2831957 RepID=UPI00391CDF97
MTAATRPAGLPAYIAVTAAYWAFMLTDGALRMLVLLHFHVLGFTPFQLAFLFLLYEFMGVVTNLSTGWIAARFGLTSTLYAGLALQIGALLLLAALDPEWALLLSVVYVMVVQGLSGVAKDLSKMSAKSAVKLLAPEGEGALFRWVAALTGSKNAVKGAGFLIGAASLGLFGFEASVMAMAGALAFVLAAVALFMPAGLPAGRKEAKFREVWSKDRDVNRLSLARMFLFGARDVWFVVGIPVYFYSVLSDGTAEGNREAFFLIGAFMACWIIGYGAVQGFTPAILKAKGKPLAEIVRLARRWVFVLAFIPAGLAGLALVGGEWLPGAVVAGLLVFGAVFALNSALHSYLILALSPAGRVTMDVGFYYMANAVGRLLGTLLSGLSYQAGGLPLCLGTAAAMAALSWLAARGIAGSERP